MSTDVLAPQRHDHPSGTVATATLRLVRSPVRSAHGSLRLVEQDVLGGQTVAAALPSQHQWAQRDREWPRADA